MKLLKVAAAFVCAVGLTAFASTSSVTATLTDSDGIAWSNCSWSAVINSPSPPTIAGTPVPDSQLRANGSCSASGVITATMLDTSSVQQSGTVWDFTIQPNASVKPSVVSGVAIAGSTVSLSSVLSAGLTAPRFAAGANAYGYADIEINSSSLGNTYFNTGSEELRQLNLAGWSAVGSSGTSSQALLAQIPQSGLIGLYTYADCSNPYKDYSGNGNDGAPASGISEPFCDAQGLHYYSPTTGPNAWKLPNSLTASGLTYVFGIVPMIGGALGADYPSLVRSDSTGGILGLYMNQTVKTTYGLGMGTTASTTTTNSLTQIPVASTVSYEIGSGVSGDKDQLFVNGTEQLYNAQGATTLAAFNVGNMLVGGPNYFNTFWGIISATAVYNRKLTALEQVQVANAINNFDQMRTGLVYPRPMASDSVSKIVCDGDSITAGVGVPVSWCSTLLNIGEAFNAVHPGATPSRYMTSLAQRAAQEIIPYYSPSAPRNTAYIMAGTNDVVNGVQPATSVWSAAIRAAANSRYGSAKIIYMPMLSRTTGDTQKNAYDALSNAQCASYYDYCVAPDDPLLYADGANSGTVGTIEACPGASTYFQADCTHPTTAGQTLLALYASNAWKQLYGSTQAAPTQVSAATYTVTASDNYITATANSVITLYNCLGYSKFVAIKVMPGLTVSVKNATSAQTIDGVDHSSSALSLTAGNNYQFQVVPGAPATGGCTWIIN